MVVHAGRASQPADRAECFSRGRKISAAGHNSGYKQDINQPIAGRGRSARELNRARHAAAVTAVFSLLFGSIAPVFAAPSAPTGDYAACQTTNEADFRKAVLDITAATLTRGTSTIDYRAAVADEWRRLDVGRTIDARGRQSIRGCQRRAELGQPPRISGQ